VTYFNLQKKQQETNRLMDYRTYVE